MRIDEAKYLESQGVPVNTTPQNLQPVVDSSAVTGSRDILIPYVKHKGVIDTYLLAVPLGFLGAHHFYLGRHGFGLLYLFTFGLLGVGWIVDWFRVPCLVKEANDRYNQQVKTDEKSVSDAYLLWFPLGFLGLHHFYLHRWVWGLVYFFSFGLLGIGWLADGFRLWYLVHDFNKNPRPVFPQEKKVSDAYILTLCPITGLLGVPHYYLGRTGFGVMYTLTLGFCGVGFLLDLFRMPYIVKRTNRINQEGRVFYDRAHYDDAYLMLFPLGFLGLHHFYLRRPCWGVLYLFTVGLFGIGWIIDFFRMPCLIKQYNAEVERRHMTHGNNGNVVVQVQTTFPNPPPQQTPNPSGYGSNDSNPQAPAAAAISAQLPPYQPPYQPNQPPFQGVNPGLLLPQANAMAAAGQYAYPAQYPQQGYYPYQAGGLNSLSTITSSEGDQPPSYLQATEESQQNSLNESQASAPPVPEKH